MTVLIPEHPCSLSKSEQIVCTDVKCACIGGMSSHVCLVHRDGCRKLEEVFPPYVIGREEAIFHMAWAGNICLASKTHNDIRTRTHREVYCPNDTARAPLKYLSPAVLGCCVCQPNVCWYPSHYAKCIICHVVGRCLVCGPMDNSQTLQMNVSHNTHGHRAPLPLLLVIPLPHSLPNLLTPPLTDSPPPFFSFTHTCSFKANSLTLPMPFSLAHSYSLSQSLVCCLPNSLPTSPGFSSPPIYTCTAATRVWGFLWLLELTQTHVLSCGLVYQHREQKADINYTINTASAPSSKRKLKRKLVKYLKCFLVFRSLLFGDCAPLSHRFTLQCQHFKAVHLSHDLSYFLLQSKVIAKAGWSTLE